MRTTIKEQALAAYMRMQGAQIVSAGTDRFKNQKQWVFDTDKTAVEWKAEYLNSQFSKYNTALIEMADFARKHEAS